MEHLRLVIGSVEWVFPDNAWITGWALNVRRKENARALQHGIIDSGDGKINGRTVEVTLIVDESTTEDYYAMLDSIKRWFYRRNQRLYVTQYRYINITSLYQLKEEFYPGLANRCAKVVAEFKCDDPFLYDDDGYAQIVSVTPTSDTTNVEVLNKGTAEISPVITVVATGPVPFIKITNTTNGRVCLYKDPQMTTGQTLVINGAQATVERNGVNTINNFTGAFQILEANVNWGVNELEIECAPACTITISYVSRWL